MGFDPGVRYRRSIRVRGFDYALPGAYFVTASTEKRICWLGGIANGEMVLSEAGLVVQSLWQDLPKRFPTVELDAFIVMPNHVHGIILLVAPVGARFPRPGSTQVCVEVPNRQADEGAQTPRNAARSDQGAETAPLRQHGPTLGQVVGYFKYQTTKRINETRRTAGLRIWQRNYYEHIIRDEVSLQQIREYVMSNPLMWEADQLNPSNPAAW